MKIVHIFKCCSKRQHCCKQLPKKKTFMTHLCRKFEEGNIPLSVLSKDHNYLVTFSLCIPKDDRYWISHQLCVNRYIIY